MPNRSKRAPTHYTTNPEPDQGTHDQIQAGSAPATLARCKRSLVSQVMAMGDRCRPADLASMGAAVTAAPTGAIETTRFAAPMGSVTTRSAATRGYETTRCAERLHKLQPFHSIRLAGHPSWALIIHSINLYLNPQPARSALVNSCVTPGKPLDRYSRPLTTTLYVLILLKKGCLPHQRDFQCQV